MAPGLTIPAAVFKVTFKEDFPVELVHMLRDTEFVGLSAAYSDENPRVLYLKPTIEQHAELKAQLQELEREGALSFVEELN